MIFACDERRKLRVMELAEVVNAISSSQNVVRSFAGAAANGNMRRWVMNGYAIRVSKENGRTFINIMNCGRSLVTGKDPRSSELVINFDFFATHPWYDAMSAFRKQVLEQYRELYLVAYQECKDQMERYPTSFPWIVRLFYMIGLNWKPKMFRPKREWMNNLITFEYRFLALWKGESYQIRCRKISDSWRDKIDTLHNTLDRHDDGIYRTDVCIKQPMLNIFKKLYTL